jgi:hypothetical protein
LPVEPFAWATLAFGALAGFATGLGGVGPSMAIIYPVEQPSLRLRPSNSGWPIRSYTLTAALIGGWK